jgi:hypothetical protein
MGGRLIPSSHYKSKKLSCRFFFYVKIKGAYPDSEFRPVPKRTNPPLPPFKKGGFKSSASRSPPLVKGDLGAIQFT